MDTPNALNLMLQHFLQVIDGGFLHLSPAARNLLSGLALLELLSAAIWWMFAHDDVLVQFLVKVMRFGFFQFVVFNLQQLTSIVEKSFIRVGLLAAGNVMSEAEFRDPGGVLHQGLEVTEALFQFTFSFSGLSGVVANLFSGLVFLIAGLLIMAAFMVVALHIMLALIEFHVVATLSTILIPFGVNRYTAWIAEGVFGGLVGGGVRLMALAFVTSIGVPVMHTLVLPTDPTLNQTFSVLAAAFALAVLVIAVPAIASGMVAGGPALTGGAAIRMGAGLMVGGIASYRILRRTSQGAGRLLRGGRPPH